MGFNAEAVSRYVPIAISIHLILRIDSVIQGIRRTKNARMREQPLTDDTGNHPRSDSRSKRKSSGIGASNCMSFPLTGCRKASFHACSAWRGRSFVPRGA